MANGFLLDSEQLQQSPQQQQLTAQQPAPAQGQGGGFNLLDVLKGLGNVVAETGAYYAASQGRPQLLEQMQKQKRQENLLSQLQSLSQQELQGPFGQILQRQMQFGDLEGAKKTLTNLPKYKQAQEVFKNPKLGFSPSEQESLQLFASLDPDVAVKLGSQLKVGKATRERQIEVKTLEEQQRLAKEEREQQRRGEQTPGAIIAKAIRENKLTAENAEKALPGLLRRAGQKVPTNAAERQVYIQDLLSDPELQLIPASQKAGIFSRIGEKLFGGQPAAPAQGAAPTPQAPATPQGQGQIMVSPSTGRRFLKNPDGTMTELK